jgi:hypothetical protein
MTRTLNFTCALVAALLFAGCGGGSSGGSGGSIPPGTETAELSVAVTDAATDEIDVFEVDVVGFRFERSDGATVEVLSQTARVDFAQLVSVSEVIATGTLPAGRYEKAYMTLDFAGAMVRISGSTTTAQLVDGAGQPLTGSEELEISFPNGGFTATPRGAHFAEIDFDLDQSLLVDALANKVTVDTLLFATIDPANPKPARAPGLTSDFTGTSFNLDVRRGLGLVSRGKLTVNTTSTTVFGLDGQVLVGQAGYDALKARGDKTLVVASGVVDPVAKTVAATRVIFLPQNLDEVGGMVVARTGGPGGDTTLTLRGVAVRRSAGSVTFNDTVTIKTSFSVTRVSKRGVANVGSASLNTDAINVGQRILAYGTFTSGTELDLTTAGAGFVRLVLTDMAGSAAAPPSGSSLKIDATRIGRRLIKAYDFDVNGVAQADPDAIEASTGGLGLASIVSATPVVVRGFFKPVSAAVPTGPTFEADTVIDRTNAASLVRVAWLPAVVAPVATSSTGLTLDVSNAQVKNVDRGLVAPTQLSANPTFVSPGTNGFYAIRQGFKLSLFQTFDAWEKELRVRLDAGAKAHRVRGLGKWDATSNTLTAKRAVAILTR